MCVHSSELLYEVWYEQIKKNMYYNEVTFLPRDSKYDEVKLCDGSQVQVYPSNEWLTVIFMHVVLNGSKLILHLSTSSETSAPIISSKMDQVTGIKTPEV